MLFSYPVNKIEIWYTPISIKKNVVLCILTLVNNPRIELRTVGHHIHMGKQSFCVTPHN